MVSEVRSGGSGANRGPSQALLLTTAPARAIVHLTLIALAAATLALAGQPIYANDTWIHLALGEVFLRDGPWLAADPHLFAAAAPPSPSSWLGSAAIYSGYALFGFTGLRIAHALAVAAILVLAWIVMRRAGASPAVASAGLVGFIVLSTYRLVQLRPDLFTIGATLALYPLLFASREGPTTRRIAITALLAAIWANVHAAFILGPALALGAGAVAAASSWLPGGGDARASERRRALRLGLAGIAMLAASCLNPQGIRAHLAYAMSGTNTLALEAVIDEWGPTNLLAWPIPFLPPTVAAWLMCWLGVIGTLAACALWLRERTLRRGPRDAAVDPVLLALAAAGLVAAVMASRFLWLGLFSLALIGSIARRFERPETSHRSAWLAGALVLFVLASSALHVSSGDWPLVSRAMRAENADYAAPYPSERYNTHAIWFLADTGVEGRIFNDYPLGGFMSFWLAPKLQMASSGTMNVTREAMETNFAVGARQTLRADEDYAALLDRQGFDLFLGSGYPIEATPGRPIPCTTRHLEHEPGWLLVFRNLRSALYLRRNAENAENLERIAAYYAEAGVPFDRERGFETEGVIRTAPRWAIDHGVVPVDFEALVAHVRSLRQQQQVDLQTHRLAILYATLGLYERALQIDRFILKLDPGDSISAWRVIWSLVQGGRWNEALEAAGRFEARSPVAQASGANPWSAMLAKVRAADPSARATLVAHLPVLRLEQVDWLRSGVVVSPARFARTPSPP